MLDRTAPTPDRTWHHPDPTTQNKTIASRNSTMPYLSKTISASPQRQRASPYLASPVPCTTTLRNTVARQHFAIPVLGRARTKPDVPSRFSTVPWRNNRSGRLLYRHNTRRCFTGTLQRATTHHRHNTTRNTRRNTNA